MNYNMKTRIIRSFVCIFFQLFITLAFSQTTPKLISWYYRDNQFPFGIEHLSLSSDGIFFFTISSESGQCLLAKGNWRKKRNTLILHSWDSTLAYPKPKIDLINESGKDTIIITAVDYFNMPFDGLT